VKIPVTNTQGHSSGALVKRLAALGVKMNITAMTTLEQIEEAVQWVVGGPPCCLSLFAGRIADTGRDPVPMVRAAVAAMRRAPNAELIWASPRELLNIFQANDCGCHIITATDDVLKKLPLVGKDLGEYSLETVRMFHDDAQRAGFSV